MKKNQKIIYIFLCSIITMFITSCNNKRFEKDLKQLAGTTIAIPYDKLIVKNFNRQNIIHSEYTYIAYYDSMVCSSCTLKNMYYWDVLNDSISKLGGKVSFIFIFSPPKDETDKFLNDLKYLKIKFPALVDTAGLFLKFNKQIPPNPNFHAFLLDKKKKIILVGNVQNNQSIEKILFKIIKNDE